MIRAHRAPAWYSVAGIAGGIGVVSSGFLLGIILVILVAAFLKLGGF